MLLGAHLCVWEQAGHATPELRLSLMHGTPSSPGTKARSWNRSPDEQLPASRMSWGEDQARMVPGLPWHGREVCVMYIPEAAVHPVTLKPELKIVSGAASPGRKSFCGEYTSTPLTIFSESVNNSPKRNLNTMNLGD